MLAASSDRCALVLTNLVCIIKFEWQMYKKVLFLQPEIRKKRL
jgi:hypothetical protein